MTNWDNIVTDKELKQSKRLRKNLYIEQKVRKVCQEELEGEGWEFVRKYADDRFVKVKKKKLFDELFEDKVWFLFAQMGFESLNKDRQFKMSYDFHNADLTQQIDVFAVDQETILIIECKAADSLKDGNFKKEIEALHGQMSGLRKEALKQYPNRKVRFIWATDNYILNRADLKRLEEWGIVNFNRSMIQYYEELVKHLGTCARYQLLGNLFANQEIKNMDTRIPAIEGKMGGYTYYAFSIEPEKLLKLGYVLHRSEANKNMMPTYQRIIKKKRLKEVQNFINNGGYFPNSLIVSIESDKKVQFDLAAMKVENSLSKIGVLHLPKKYHSIYIIDGQHRLYGYSDTPFAEKNSIPVVAFINLDRNEQLKIFMDINENQKAVSKTLRVTLNSDMLWDSKNGNEKREALRSKIAQMCGEEATSPLHGRIVIGEDEKNATKCITIEAIQVALKKCQFFSVFSKNNTIQMNGTFDFGENQSTCDSFYPFLEQCLAYVKSEAEEEWMLGENGILTINRGIQAVIRVINDIINHLIKQSKINPLQDKEEHIFSEVQYYLKALVDFLKGVDINKRKELKSFLGGGADTKFWREFQRIIANKYEDFQPEGLSEYLENETQQYNNEARQYLNDIESKLKEKIEIGLQQYYGENWEIKGLPKTVYKKAEGEANDRNYENVSKDEEDVEFVTAWDYVDLLDFKSIVIYGSNWSEIFDDIITRPEDKQVAGGKEAKTKWIETLSKEKNKLVRTSSYSVPKMSFELISEVHQWIVNADD
ncbi:DNA sulfur modification protein DndB [Eubacterium aggregans]|uniref:DNA sulfur modification protein DndB n=1 Tax=Eubacterium aggregans TaxID=81409 RepID=A0A1H4CK60_9FIRM|nr:DGQHR domain-containing protein [Eubacterium aggregans]SEA60747.1 DNA sulfur modification protein DndB [Eubacterium aggregans]